MYQKSFHRDRMATEQITTAICSDSAAWSQRSLILPLASAAASNCSAYFLMSPFSES